MILFFIIIQSTLLFFILFHDWIPVPPYNDIPTLRKRDSISYRLIGSLVNGAMVAIPLGITLLYYKKGEISFFGSGSIAAFYSLLTIGTIMSWWVPYFFGSSQKLKEEFSKFKKTHHFLPPRGDNVVPNTLHVVLHLQVWICLAISLYYL